MRSAHLPYAEHGAADSCDQKYNASGRGKLPNACLVELRDDLKNSDEEKHKPSTNQTYDLTNHLPHSPATLDTPHRGWAYWVKAMFFLLPDDLNYKRTNLLLLRETNSKLNLVIPT
jgi:hypothetical protein